MMRDAGKLLIYLILFAVIAPDSFSSLRGLALRVHDASFALLGTAKLAASCASEARGHRLHACVAR
jgi:hypothetical protein